MKAKLREGVLRVRSALARQVAFVGRGTWYLDYEGKYARFMALGESVEKRFPVIVAGRTFCFEVEHHIPVDSFSEARKVAKNIPVPAPFEGLRKVKIIPATNGGFQAVITTIDLNAVKTVFPSTLGAVIPVSWLIPHIAQNDAAQMEFCEEVLGFSPSGTVGKTLALRSQHQIRDFWWAVGVEPDNVATISQDTVAERMLPAVLSLQPSLWFEAFRDNQAASEKVRSSLDFLKIGKVIGAVACCYLAFSSSVLLGLENWYAAEVKDESSDFSTALNARSTLNELVEMDQQWRSIKSAQYPIWSVWPVMEALPSEGLLVQSIEMSEGVIEVDFFALDSTQVLNAIIASPFAKNVEFGRSVETDIESGVERFTVRWELSEPSTSATGTSQ